MTLTVLHVMNGTSGGAAVSTLDLMERLARDGVRSVAVSLDVGTSEGRARLLEATEGHAELRPLRVWNRKVRARLWKRPALELIQLWRTAAGFGSAHAVARAARGWNADLIHTNTLLNPEGAWAARRLGLPHVWHVRELVGAGRPFRFWREGPRLGRYLVHHCAKVVANSEATAACLRAWLPQPLLAVVPNGIDLARFSPAARRGQGPPVVAMVASLSSRSKKHALFLEAAARVDVPALFRIYGDTPHDAYVAGLRRRAAELGLAERLEWMGHAPDPAATMAEVDLLVHPNDAESFGRVVLEAMAAGRAVVGVNGGGVADIVEHERTGLLGPPDDAPALAANVVRLLRDPELRRRYGNAGRERVARHFSLDVHVTAMRAVYAEALANATPGKAT